jgi:hypothetical protein
MNLVTLESICHVGYTKSTDDFDRVVKVSDWLTYNNIVYPDKSAFIDLTRGKDFLTMKDTYDIVVLHFICRWEKRHVDRIGGEMPPELSISEHASWSNWRKRLVSTNAEAIHLFGGQGEVGGSYIATLDGYRGEKLADVEHRGAPTEWWVFRKENSIC